MEREGKLRGILLNWMEDFLKQDDKNIYLVTKLTWTHVISIAPKGSVQSLIMVAVYTNHMTKKVSIWRYEWKGRK